MANFLEEFFFGRMNPETGEVDGGIPGFLDTFVPDPGTTASNLVNETLLGQIATAPIRGSAQIIGAGLQGIEAGESYVIARPASTVLQALGVSNPLYRDGVQLQDFLEMWNASEYISPGRAGITNIGSGIGMLETIARGGQAPFTGGASWNEFSYGSGYNPYSAIGGLLPEEVEKKWDSSALGTVGSLSLDTAFVIVAGGKGVNAAASALRRGAGLQTTIKNARDLGSLRDSMYAHKKWLDTAGQEGSRTVPGRLIEDLVEESDYTRVLNSPMLDNWTRSGSFNRDELADLITKTDDYDTVVELLLADRGDAVAIGQLFQAAPDRVWALSDMNEIMQRQFAAGGQFIPDANAANRIRQTFDTAADRDEFFASVRDMFMRTGETGVDEGLITSIRGSGSDFMPMGTTGIPVARDVVGYAQRWLKKTMADARINRPNTWNEITIPGQTPRSPVTKLLFWAGGRRPLNVVSYNTMRPTEVVDEMLAYSRSSRALRQREFTVTRMGDDGLSETVTMPAFQWRAEALQRIGEAKRGGVTNLDAVVRQLEDELVSTVVNKYAVSGEDVSRVIRGLREQSDAAQAQVARDGYWLDSNGDRIVIDPVTQSQLADSFVLMPLDDLDWALRSISETSFARRGRATRAGMRTTAAGLDFIYRWFRTNVLFRPGYVPKNSFAEPAVAELLADGSLLAEGGLRKTTGRFIRNANRRVTQFRYGVADRLPRSGARKDAERLQVLRKQYDDLRVQQDELDLLVRDLDSAGTNPATRDKYLASAMRERKTVHRRIKQVEQELDLADANWAQVDEIPTYGALADRFDNLRVALTDDDWAVTATSRIDELVAKGDDITVREQSELVRLQGLLSAKTKMQESKLSPDELLDDIQRQLDEIREETFTVEPGVLAKQKKLEERLKKLDGQRATLEERIAARQIARERVRSREFSGEDEFVIRSAVDGKEYTVPGIFSEEPGMFGSAMRADSAADLTAMQTMTGGTFSGARSGRRWRQSESGEVITPFDERYWEQLAYIANRHVRNDPFARQILEGKTDAEILRWFRTPEGKSYSKRMGWNARELTGRPVNNLRVPRLFDDAGPSATRPSGPDPRITVFDEGIIARNRRLMNGYFRSGDIRQRMLSGDELTPGELQRSLGVLDDLEPIYGTGLEFIGNRASRVNRALNNAADKVWANLAVKPESRFGRWPFMQREYRRQMQREIDLRTQQGIVVDGNMLQAMRVQASARALKEMENTFYNIRRMTNPVYALRYVTAFPAAAWNTVYRYYRLGYKSPGNALVLTNSWINVLEYSSVDEEGNPVTDWKDAHQVVISFPDDLDIPISPEIKVRADSINLGTQESGLLPTLTVPVSAVLMRKPELEGWMKDNMPEIYDAIFPYGPGTDPDFVAGPFPIDPFMASYQKKALTVVRSLFQEIPDEDFLRVVTQDYSYKMFEWAKNNYEGPAPSYEDSITAAQQYYGIGAFLSWAMFGSYQLSPEGQFYRDEYYRLLEKHPDDYPAAMAEGTTLYGPEFMYMAMPTSKNRAGMPPTQDALAIFNANSELLNDLRKIDPDNPQFATQLLFLDEQAYNQEDFSQAVYDWSFNATLPGDVAPIRSRRSIQETSDEIARSQGWSIYNAAVANRDSAILQYGDSEELDNQWSAWLEQFKEDNPIWYADFDDRSSEKAFRALNAIDTVLGNESFMNRFGNTQTWEIIGYYRVELENARATYESVSSDEKKDVAEAWDRHVREVYLPVAGNFSGYYERFLAGRDIAGRQLLDIEFNIPSLPIPALAETSGVE